MALVVRRDRGRSNGRSRTRRDAARPGRRLRIRERSASAGTPPPAEAVVMALRTRVAPRGGRSRASGQPRADCSTAARGRFFFKYCATFNSTDDGNIGPCADLLAARHAGAPDLVLPELSGGRAACFPGPSVRRRPTHLGIAQALRSADADDRPQPRSRASAANQDARRPAGAAESCAPARGPERLPRSALRDEGKPFAIVDAATPGRISRRSPN